MPSHHGQSGLSALGLAVLLSVAAAVYLAAAADQPRSGRQPWPAHRTVLWLLGLATIAAAGLGPLAGTARQDFPAHMAAHLLAGMLAPLLMALSAPVTLALRTLGVGPARRLSRLLNSRPARFLTHPATAAILNTGSLWALYATPLSDLTLRSAVWHHVLLAHFFLTGYLLTASLVGIDPAPHRTGFPQRLAVLGLAIAAHAILAKHLYAHPPAGVPAGAARQGAMLMYYGGDLLELALLALVCARWYRAARPAASRAGPAATRPATRPSARHTRP